MKKQAKKKPAAKAKPKAAAGTVAFTLDARKDGLDVILGTAYLMSDRAYARLDGDRAKILTVTLTPKGARGAKELKDLEAAFTAEFESQKVRWALARANQPIREYLVENAVALAQGRAEAAAAAAPAAPEELTADQRAEIERLISEVETEIKEMNDKKAHADPKGVSPSWEAQQQGAPEKA
jgi:His-Xaa-Ser system protein HxsD